ncbi:MAG: DUF167 family protein [Methanomassiliicoccales archaeon]
MAGASSTVDFSKAVRVTKEGTEIDVMVSPHSTSSGIQGIDQWRGRIIVKIRAPPEAGKANKELIELFSGMLGKAELGRGSTNRMKTIVVHMSREDVLRILEAAP